MEERATYRKIHDKIRDEIYAGDLKPGDKLPGVREMSQRWHCTPGTVQRAYQLLTRSGLVTSQPGKGTLILDGQTSRGPHQDTLRRTGLVIRAEQFLLECATAGYTLEEITSSLTLAAEHWRVLESSSDKSSRDTIRVMGSSDTVINALSEVLPSILPGLRLDVQVAGSMIGLLALSQGSADLAGCHLWDADTDSYNIPFIKKVLPMRPVRVVTFAHRRLGMLTTAGNPMGIHSLSDLTREDVRFINRQSGSGTRVWLDEQLVRKNISSLSIRGYALEKATHMEVAREIAEDRADAGLGLESAARAFGLDFQLLTLERYDLVCDQEKAGEEPVAGFIRWLQTDSARQYINTYPGYVTTETGRIVL